jgi:hypothetical protein
MPETEIIKKCSCCGVNKYIFSKCLSDWTYKLKVKNRTLFQCSYNCWRKEQKKYGLKEWKKIED